VRVHAPVASISCVGGKPLCVNKAVGRFNRTEIGPGKTFQHKGKAVGFSQATAAAVRCMAAIYDAFERALACVRWLGHGAEISGLRFFAWS
jgi:hypothetical protein